MHRIIYLDANVEERKCPLYDLYRKHGSAYCTACVSGQGSCRHSSEWMWYQYYHWTDERLGINWPSILGECGWVTGGKVLNSDVRQKIQQQQIVKYEKSIAVQNTKTERGVKRYYTEGYSGDYQIHLSASKTAV